MRDTPWCSATNALDCDEDRLVATSIRQQLRAGSAPRDAEFDQLLCVAHRKLSANFWTPVEVALVVARWFEASRASSVLDIGAGIGKFCAIGAVATSATYFGIERREVLAESAVSLAEKLGVGDRVRVLVGELGVVAAPRTDAIYCFNPFGEHLFSDGEVLDESIVRSVARYRHDAALVTQMLRDADVGAVFCTYNGFGGKIPRCYELLRCRTDFSCPLRLWRKTRLHRGEPELPEEEFAELELLDSWNDVCSIEAHR
ncbi:MAG: class I SAM-dependent methyltransferase [Myxococcales bacterium]|nr:class I SAM-dependent methyltransferase [Myxococcales bacterium]